MLNALSLWVRQIVTVVMFATFVDFLIPENKFFRYIKVFLGLLVMMAIVNPLVPLLHKNVYFDENSLDYEDFIDKASITYNSEELNKRNNELALEEYKKQVEEYLTQKIAEMTYCDVKSIFIKTNENYTDENFGKITQLYIVLGKNQTGSEKSKGKIFIETIKINCDDRKSNTHNYESNSDFKNIIEFLHTTFDISDKNIFIDLED
jgi:stage III sporulation protein AF